MTEQDFALRYDRWFLPFSVPLGLGPRRARIRLAAGALEVRMGWAFRARIPLDAIRTAAPAPGRVTGWGVHGFAGDWLVNGSARGLVRLEVDPAASARMMGIPVPLRRLRLSVTDPAAFVAAVRSVA
ncbi:hypothetical protein [Kitasatospora camelliae]|uniref:Polyketide cyclase/dehydrase/lipid transport protein n=1 Tax=Kitasatospora camelliae TaxID=3156397 RepID=A0AAU8K3U9_9ACTN